MNSEKSHEAARKTATEPELQKAPSMLWFAVPLAILIAYALLTR